MIRVFDTIANGLRVSFTGWLVSLTKWTVYRTRKKWDFWISGSYNHEEPGSTESITTGIEGGYQRSGVDHSSFYEAEGR